MRTVCGNMCGHQSDVGADLCAGKWTQMEISQGGVAAKAVTSFRCEYIVLRTLSLCNGQRISGKLLGSFLATHTFTHTHTRQRQAGLTMRAVVELLLHQCGGQGVVGFD